MRILIRTSKWAIWSRRFGSLAVPLAVIPVFLHREQLIQSSEFAVIEAIAFGVAVLAVVLALGAYIRLWITGDQGWSKATWGLVFGLICVLPIAYLIGEAARYPVLNEVSTDFNDPLPLQADVRPAPTNAAQRMLIE